MSDAIKHLITEDCKKSCNDISIFSELANQVILVTGGTGFMGKWIAEIVSFLNETENLNISLYLLARDTEKFKDEVPHLAAKQFIKLINQDVRNLHDLPEEVNHIIHAAGTPDNRDHVSQPLRTLETFYKGTNNVLDAATRLPALRKILHVSSHTVYGKNTDEAYIKETYLGTLEVNNVNHIYGESKIVAETLCSIFRNQFKLPITILRPFAFIGPYHDLEKPWAINNFIRDGILGGPIRILGNGSTIRSYLYASDMAVWVLKALVNGQVGDVYNLGSNVPISLNDLATKIQTSINPNIEILSKSSKENYSNVSRLVPETSKTIKALDVQETHTLDDAISRTIVWNQLNKK
ncbi:NAD(P)-dependent oxidoreductase [Pedobacter frigidisoli]|uniref:NAD(P)-dependent oxidoreductase n=1 Tax=Pedobacter frigidisoli TaxID=2530455 RepID=A0A4R0NPM5_9SPHI|nr:NAD(P)-dependent oxidoreductase [Pedobacter frigidisoli]TCD01958.1 NAD(P)-dependent oxidoreductase [Pedobacter frigidisoli]